MKKSLLLFVAALAAQTFSVNAAMPGHLTSRIARAEHANFTASPMTAPQTQAPAVMKSAKAGTDQNMEFGYALQTYTAYSFKGTTPGKTMVYLAVQIQPEDLARLVGNKITGINVTHGISTTTSMNPVNEVAAFVTDDLTTTPTNVKFGNLGKTAWGVTSITLDTPFEITSTEKPVYFGYVLTVPTTSNSYYVPVDGIAGAPGSLIYGMSNTDAMPTKWQQAGGEMGALCLTATISGTTLPKNMISVFGSYFPNLVTLNTTGNLALGVKNQGSNLIQSLEVTTKVADQEPYVKTVTFENPIPSNSWAEVAVEGVPFNTEGIVNVTASITKVNGEAVETPISISGSTTVLEHGYDRNLVIEEATGTWCGWCPGGIVMLEYINENYGDRFFSVAVHGGNSTEPMKTASYAEFLNNVSGFPYSITNRVEEFSPGSTVEAQKEFVDGIYQQCTSTPTYCKVDFTGEMEGTDNIKISANAEFSLSVSESHSLAFIVVEDSVGPYLQSNYYGTENVPMAGWEKEGSKVKMLFNDVARYIDSYPSIENSLPATIEKGKVYTCDRVVPVKNVKGSKFRVIAIITNDKTGEIVNASKVEFEKPVDTAISGVEAENNVAVSAANGSITVTGAKTWAVYSIDGRKVASASSLTPGIYVVVADGHSQKVVVR